MAYDARRNDLFFRRVNNLAQGMSAMRKEAADLDLIYTQEAEAGAHAAFVDHQLGTTAEAVDMITVIRAYEAFHSNAAVLPINRQLNLAPFLANQEP